MPTLQRRAQLRNGKNNSHPRRKKFATRVGLQAAHEQNPKKNIPGADLPHSRTSRLHANPPDRR